MKKWANIVVFHHQRSSVDERNLKDCLESLYEQTIIRSCNVYVFLNNIEGLSFQAQTLSPIDKKPTSVMGFVKHAALQVPTDCPFLFPLNNDIVFLTPNSLEALMENLADTKVGIVASGTTDKGAGWLYVEQPKEMTLTVPHVDNHCWGTRLDIFEKVGFPEQVGHWADWFSNIDFCHRVRQEGYQVKAVLSSFVKHKGGVFTHFNSKAKEAGWAWFCQKYLSEESRKAALGGLYG